MSIIFRRRFIQKIKKTQLNLSLKKRNAIIEGNKLTGTTTHKTQKMNCHY